MPQVFRIQPDATATVDNRYMESVQLTSTDPQTITYTINPAATWSNGRPITWEDFRAQWQALNGTDPAYNVSSTTGYQDIASVERGADDRQAVVTFETNFADWKSLFSPLYPMETNSDPQVFNEGWTQQPQTTAGPFKLGNLDSTAQRITLVRNENWWGRTPRLERIIYSVIDTDAQANAYANGAVDFYEVSSIVSKFTRAQQIPNTELRKAFAPDMRHMTFNGAPGSILENRELRIAVQQGINRQAIADALLGRIIAEPTPLGNHIFRSEAQQGYQDNDAIVEYNPEEAARMLDELGWTRQGDGIRTKDGQRLVIRDVIPTGVENSEQEAKIAREQLRQIGVDLQIDVVPVADFFEKHIMVGDFDVTHFSWLGTAFPMSASGALYTLGGETQQNFGRLGNETINRLFAEANSELDEQRRLELANRIDTEIWKTGHSLLLYARPDIQAVQSDVANFGAFGFADPIYTDIGFMQQ
ncbi:MAG: ABC transporter family substrate-binding protein [Pseudonocardiaceae bacterium]|nr:ABC transporter family substrate-binding protein [Pseudonocardiaceae bacterium]